MKTKTNVQYVYQLWDQTTPDAACLATTRLSDVARITRRPHTDAIERAVAYRASTAVAPTISGRLVDPTTTAAGVNIRDSDAAPTTLPPRKGRTTRDAAVNTRLTAAARTDTQRPQDRTTLAVLVTHFSLAAAPMALLLLRDLTVKVKFNAI